MTERERLPMQREVIPIDREDALPFLKCRHYAKRIPSISYAYGLLKDGILVGVCTYGTPPSHTLLKGVAGDAWASAVLELNRLTCENESNNASFLVGRSLRLLPKPSIVVSYADTGAGHVGYVYQATNFLYTGLSSAWNDPVVRGLEHQHHATFAHGKSNDEMREEFGDALSFRKRSRKHRYLFICANKQDRARIVADLRYKAMPYPKGETTRHMTKPTDIQGFLFCGNGTLAGDKP
jgi:hypothetical protein